MKLSEPATGYTVTYELQANITLDAGYSLPSPLQNVIELTEINLPNLAATGYTFLGWYNGENKVAPTGTESYPLTGNITLTAKFSAQ